MANNEKTLNSRFQQKHDIEANWIKATNFIPKEGEIIVYDVDENHSKQRVKIGDGVKNVNKLPFLGVGEQEENNGEIFNDYANNVASGKYSHAQGYKTNATGDYSHAEGYLATASGKYSYASGQSVTASGVNSRATGVSTTAEGVAAHAEGKGTTASNTASHAEGRETIASGAASHAEGYITTASGNYSHAEGNDTEAKGAYSHVEGSRTMAEGSNAHAEGHETVASGDNSHAEGNRTVASGRYSHAEGIETQAIGPCSHAEGYNSLAQGERSHAEGGNTIALGKYAHAEGTSTSALGNYSHAEGVYSVASTRDSHAEGGNRLEEGEEVCRANDLITLPIATEDYTPTEEEIFTYNRVLEKLVGVYGTTIEVVTTDKATLDAFIKSMSTAHQSVYNHPYSYTAGSGAHAEGSHTNALGLGSHTEGYGTYASGLGAHAEGQYTAAIGTNAHAEGYNTTATGSNSHAEGNNTKSGFGAHAEGSNTQATGSGSHAEGASSTASGYVAHAEGFGTKAVGSYSHAEGRSTIASGNHSHVQGIFNIEDTANKYAHIVGNGTASSRRSNAHTLDWDGNAWFAGKATVGVEPTNAMDVATKGYVDAHSGSIGGNIIDAIELPSLDASKGTIYRILKGETVANGMTQNEAYIVASLPAEGKSQCIYYVPETGKCYGYFSESDVAYEEIKYDFGWLDIDDALEAWFNNGTDIFSGIYWDKNNLPLYDQDFGYERWALFLYYDLYFYDGETFIKVNSSYGTEHNAVILNSPLNSAKGFFAHAEGQHTFASGQGSHAEGINTGAVGGSSHVEGYYTTTTGNYAHAEGYYTRASGLASHAEGGATTADGAYSHTEGYGTQAISSNQHAQGKYNIKNTSNTYAHIVGNGTRETARSNAHTIDWSGNATFAGSVTGSGADYAEHFEWLDGNPNKEDRVGTIVTLEGDKIRFANPEDEILGVVSGTAMVVGDNAEWEWQGKFLTDDYGRVIVEMIEEFDDERNSLGFFPHRKINPEWNETQEYVRRSDRPEWDVVGLFGKLHVNDDGTCIVGGYATCGANGVATASTEKTNMKVMKRITDNIILVFMK